MCHRGRRRGCRRRAHPRGAGGGQQRRPVAVRAAGAGRGDATAHRPPPRGVPRDRRARPRRAAGLPRRDGRRQAAAARECEPVAAAGGGAGRPVPLLPSDHRPSRSRWLALRASGPRRRGLLGLAGPARHGVGRGRPALRGRPRDGPARPGRSAARHRAPCPRLLVRAPGAGGRRMIAEALTLDHRRGLVRALISPHPLGDALPALFQEDGFTQRFMSAFDAALAPVFATLDNLPTYFDPWLTPPDFLEWLGSWFGLALDDSWSVERRRAVLAGAFEFYRLRGTVKGVKAQIETLTGGTAEIIDTGGGPAPPQKSEGPPGAADLSPTRRAARARPPPSRCRSLPMSA